MNLAVASLHSPLEGYAALAEVTIPTKLAYCERHGYTFIGGEPGRPGYDVQFHDWRRTSFVQAHLPAFDGILWIDADALIVNPEKRIEEIFADEIAAGYGFIYTSDLYGMNSGVWLALYRPDPEGVCLTRQMLQAIEEFGPHLTQGHPWKEQEAFIRYLASPPYRDNAVHVAQRRLQSYRNDLYHNRQHVQGMYHVGDWILHLPGFDLGQRRALAEQALAEYATWKAAGN